MTNNPQPLGPIRGPDIKFPPNNEGQEAVPVSRPRVGWAPPGGTQSPLIDKWAEAPKTKTYVLGSINGTIQWIETEECNE
jgi:hypothetical protein